MLSVVKSFEILPKHSIYGSISESFALNWYIFAAITNKKLLLPLKCRLNTNLCPDCAKLIVSAVTVALYKPCVGP